MANLLKSIFTWWTGATIGASRQIHKSAGFVGEDGQGNRYFESVDPKFSYDGRTRRFVIYNGYPEASRVPPEWHGWLHHTVPEPPNRSPLQRRAWERDHVPNMTGTVMAWRPPGSILREGERPAATGDYEAWTPD